MHASQIKVGRRNIKPRFEYRPLTSKSAIGDKDDEIREAALQYGTRVGYAEYTEVTVHVDPKQQRSSKNLDFISTMNMIAIDHRHLIFEDNNISTSVLLTSLPDTDGVGDEISQHDFQTRWQRDSLELLKHLFRKHEGEIFELSGEWMDFHPAIGGSLPECLFHEQFAKTHEQWQLLSHFRKQKSEERKGKGKGKGNKGKGKQPEAVIGATRILQPPKWQGLPWQLREAVVITMPGLFYSLRDKFSACDLYRFWNNGELLAIKRAHAWAKPERIAAAKLRYQETGRYGFGR